MAYLRVHDDVEIALFTLCNADDVVVRAVAQWPVVGGW